MDGTVLELENLSAWYEAGKDVLAGLSLRLERHEVVGLIGLNGAGKTTLLKTLSGLHEGFRFDSLRLDGRPAAFRDKRFKLCRYTVFEEDRSFQYFTFSEYLSYVAAAYKILLPDVSNLVRSFHFEAYTGTLLKDLSTGNRKKAFLITAFALRPELLLLDEPVNGLDFQSTEFLYQLIAGYREHGTLLFSSHILESITLTSDRVLVLEDGKIQKCFAGDQINAVNIREALHDENVL
ncbi:MAG: ABC transporter ATP-binding protein [Oscillibacter sp.]|nr:ABC transporter ATP-binding protein [Oscillibacter sp.]